MRDRLVELINNNGSSVLTANDFEELADYLLDNGVIVPPCKVGQTVYVNPETWGGISFINYIYLFIHSKYFLVGEVVSVIKTRKQNLIKLKVYNSTNCKAEYRKYPVSSIGKTVFTSREEAEQALKGGER